jgi:hypothetical protein
MPNVFVTSTRRGATLREKLTHRLENGDWVPTGAFYRCTNNIVKQQDIHAELKRMLDERLIVMRCIEKTGGPARTEFKLKGGGEGHGTY